MSRIFHFCLINALFVCLNFLNGIEPRTFNIPRTIVALYDGALQRPEETDIHQFAEMPLNHLGFKLYYHDIRLGFPSVREKEDVVGILSWFPRATKMSNPEAYINWAIRTILSGKKFVVMGNPGFTSEEGETFLYLTNQFWEVLGLQDTGKRIETTEKAEIVYADPKLVPFERRLEDNLPPFPVMIQLDQYASTSYLTVKVRGDATSLSQLIVISPNGAYVAEDLSIYKSPFIPVVKIIRQWYFNPFEFFRMVFDTDSIPKPDTTTLAGRRIYYSHIDGDGWNFLTRIEKYTRRKRLASHVIYREVLRKYAEWPVTVGPIGAEISFDWVGTKTSRSVGRALFRLPHIEVGCHTLSHPFQWEFFNNYERPRERVFLNQYPYGGWEHTSILQSLVHIFPKVKSLKTRYLKQRVDEAIFQYPTGQRVSIYELPRAYALKPFKLRSEVFEALREVRSVADRHAMLYQWSGDCLPFEQVIQLTRQAAVRNINGGSTRFDDEYDSYAWVSPIGRQVGNQRQIYASNASEEMYTDEWQDNFGGFTKVQQTFERTEYPIRVKPINLHYHMYSGERAESLAAVIQNLEYVQNQEVIPIEASRFSAIADGFYSTRLRLIGLNRWRVEQRGGLQTIRFDNANERGVDFVRSIGVIGQRHYQGSLYVYLDASHFSPVVALKSVPLSNEEPENDSPYLIQSRWRVWGLQHRREGDTVLITQGFGPGFMQWKVPQSGWYLVTILGSNEEENEELELEAFHNILDIELNFTSLDPIAIRLEKLSDEPAEKTNEDEESE